MKPATPDVTRIVLLVLLIALLVGGSFWTMLPFLAALLWATTIVIATWPLLLWFERKAGGRRWVAVTAMISLVMLAFIIPFAVAIDTLLEVAERGPDAVRAWLSQGLQPPPSWVSSIPLVGAKVAAKWQELSAGGPEALVEAARPYLRTAGEWAIAATGGFTLVIVHFLLTVVLIAILCVNGEVAARGVLAFARRLGGERGEQTMVLASKAVRSVALGVIVTALVQATAAGIGLWISGVPRAGVLGAIAFVLGIAQLGPLLVLAPAVIWLYSTGNALWGTILLIWSIPVIAMDNVLRPILIRRGVELPMLLIIAGVIGGLIAFGVMGLFVGPVLLAATYTLTKAWVAEGTPDALRTGTT